jgi:hypothetical protein
MNIAIDAQSQIQARAPGLRYGPFALALVLLAWLPFQNGLVAVLIGAEIIPPVLGQFVTLLKEIVLVAVLGLLVIGGRVHRWRSMEWLFVLFVGWVLLHLPFGDLPIVAQVAGIRMLVIPILMYGLGRLVPVPSGGLRQFWGLVLLICVVVIVFGWAEFLLLTDDHLAQLQLASFEAKGQDLPTAQMFGAAAGWFYTAVGSAFTGDTVWVRRMISTYLEPLALGHSLILSMVFLFYNLVEPRSALLRPRAVVVLLLIGVGLAQVLALSRGAIVGTFIGWGMIVLMSGRVRWRAMLVIAVLTSAALMVPSVRGFVINTLNREDPSTISHVKQLELGVKVLVEKPFGLGLGQGGYVGQVYAAGLAEGVAESFYFSTVSQVGVVGVILFGLGFLTLLLNLRRCFHQAQSQWLKASALIAFGALAGYGVSAVFSEAAFGMLASAAVWFLAGLVIQLRDQESRMERAAPPLPRLHPIL